MNEGVAEHASIAPCTCTIIIPFIKLLLTLVNTCMLVYVHDHPMDVDALEIREQREFGGGMESVHLNL